MVSVVGGVGGNMEDLRCPKCGGESEFVKLYPSKRYDGFMRCKVCGHEGRLYTSKQNAVKNWRKR